APAAEAAAVTPKPVQPSLNQWLADAKHPSDTDSAFGTLFSLWNTDYRPGQSGDACHEAQDAGLRCLYRRGTWNNLRGFDLPAIVTLTDAEGVVHQLVMTRLDDAGVTLRAGASSARFPLTEVEPLWYGEFLVLWRPDPHAAHPLSPGMNGGNVAWLRSQLATLQLMRDDDGNSYDADLTSAVKRFQSTQHMQVDGIAGEETLVRLSTALPAAGTPLLAGGGH
ncbi:MAG TPA: peptidoglycan-binding domain-containing protein, partial [Gammaproteobacteria bacterium]